MNPMEDTESLEARVSGIVGKVKERLSKHEITDDQYFEFVQGLLEESGLSTPTSGDFDDKRNKIMGDAIYSTEIKRVLSTTTVYGLRDDYIKLQETKMTVEAFSDIQDAKVALEGAREYIRTATGDREIDSDHFFHVITAYLKDAYPDLSTRRTLYVASRFQYDLRNEVTLRNEPEETFSGYTREDIISAFKGI